MKVIQNCTYHAEFSPNEISFLQGLSSMPEKVAETVYGNLPDNLTEEAVKFLRALNTAIQKVRNA